MTILYLTTHFNTGGITNYILTLSRQMIDRGHRVIVVSSGGDRREELEEMGAAHIQVDIRTKSVFSPKLVAAAFRVKRIVLDENVDIVHGHTRVTLCLARLLSLMTGIAFVSTCHGFFRPRFFRKLFPCWGRKVIAISDQVAQHLIDDFNVDREAVVTVRNGIDLQRFSPVTMQTRKQLQRQAGFEDKKIIGIIARLSDVKGHHILIDAVNIVRKTVPDVRLLIVGEGREEKRLKNQVNELGLEEIVVFRPVVNQTADFLKLFDCFVLPSLQEGLGLSVMEAQAAGLPVIASRVGGIPSLIEHGKTGLMVEPGKVDALSFEIINVLTDERLANDLGINARQKALREYGSLEMAEKILKVYEKER